VSDTSGPAWPENNSLTGQAWPGPETVDGSAYATVCPRCESSFIPTNDNPGAYPGALSRTDDKTEICSECGTEEASPWRKFETQDEWPIFRETKTHVSVIPGGTPISAYPKAVPVDEV
jgi:hypothetical protein